MTLPNSTLQPPGLRRRDLNRAALWLALGTWCAAPLARAEDAPRWQRNPFTLGVASGQPRPDSVVLWTRLVPHEQAETTWNTDAGCAVRYELFGDEALRQPLRSGEAMAWPSRGHSVHVTVDGLAPGRPYWYRFTCGNAVSPVGRTCTAPPARANVARLRIALASCQHWEQGFFAAHREIAQREVDFVLFVGDYIYEGSNPAYTAQTGRTHGSSTPHTLAQYRARHALYKSDADLQAAHAAHPWIVTLDDHEVVNDYADDRDPAWTEPAHFLQRRAAAYRAYFEHMPLAAPPQGPAMRIHDRFAWGRLADLWTLDTRQHRSHHACADPQRDVGRSVTACAELQDDSRTMLGAAQEHWLAQGLRGATARWKLLGNPTQISATGIETPEGRQTWTDGWDGYPAARQRLLQGIADAKVANVVSLGGDVHRHAAANLRLRPNETASPIVASELIGGSLTSRGASQAAMARMRRDNPDVLHARGDERGWALLDITANALHCEMRTTTHPVVAGATFGRQTGFVVQAGRAGVEPA
jgi:alkaline phosphatase D